VAVLRFVSDEKEINMPTKDRFPMLNTPDKVSGGNVVGSLHQKR